LVFVAAGGSRLVGKRLVVPDFNEASMEEGQRTMGFVVMTSIVAAVAAVEALVAVDTMLEGRGVPMRTMKV
jgi:hypothetical protein